MAGGDADDGELHALGGGGGVQAVHGGDGAGPVGGQEGGGGGAFGLGGQRAGLLAAHQRVVGAGEFDGVGGLDQVGDRVAGQPAGALDQHRDAVGEDPLAVQDSGAEADGGGQPFGLVDQQLVGLHREFGRNGVTGLDRVRAGVELFAGGVGEHRAAVGDQHLDAELRSGDVLFGQHDGRDRPVGDEHALVLGLSERPGGLGLGAPADHQGADRGLPVGGLEHGRAGVPVHEGGQLGGASDRFGGRVGDPGGGRDHAQLVLVAQQLGCAEAGAGQSVAFGEPGRERHRVLDGGDHRDRVEPGVGGVEGVRPARQVVLPLDQLAGVLDASDRLGEVPLAGDVGLLDVDHRTGLLEAGQGGHREGDVADDQDGAGAHAVPPAGSTVSGRRASAARRSASRLMPYTANAPATAAVRPAIAQKPWPNRSHR